MEEATENATTNNSKLNDTSTILKQNQYSKKRGIYPGVDKNFFNSRNSKKAGNTDQMRK